MVKRNTDSVERLKQQDADLQNRNLIPPADRAALFRSPTDLKYSGVPDLDAPTFPKPRAPAVALPEPKKG